MTEDQIQVILDRLDSLQKTVNRIDADLASDRKDIQDLVMKQGTLHTEVAQLKDDVLKMRKKVREDVEDAVQPITDTLEQVKKESWWKKYIKRK